MRRFPGQTQIPPTPGLIVCGGQWGSEGKGALIFEIGGAYETHVRVGGPQAGHSIKLSQHEDQVLKLQTIPVGAALGKRAVIGMASVVDPEVLRREIGWFQQLGLPLDLTIDENATILAPEYRQAESEASLTDKLGSTGKGVGFARAERIMRRAETAATFFGHTRREWPEVRVADTQNMLRSGLDNGGLLVEAAQGVLLSLFSSGYYPYVTSSEAGPTAAFADLGLPMSYASAFESVGVFRTVPIRVAGNSGPLPKETTWEDIELGRGKLINDEEKTTTVTRKLRRVARWDPMISAATVRRCGFDWAALTFLDYVYGDIEHETNWDNMPATVQAYVGHREDDLGIPIRVVGTGFGTYAWRKP